MRSDVNPSGLCMCGCGAEAPIAALTNARWGHVAGQPIRFIHGHQGRKFRPDPTDLELAWLAGLLEGEGSFIAATRYRRPKAKARWSRFDGRILLGMTDRDVVERVSALFGGTAIIVEPRGKHKLMYRTALSGGFAMDLMVRLRPLMGERRQAQIDRVLAKVSGSTSQAA